MQGPQNPHSSPDAPKRSGRFSSGSYRRVSTENTCNCRCRISKYRRPKRRNKTQKSTKPTFLRRPPESSKRVAFGLIALVRGHSPAKGTRQVLETHILLPRVRSPKVHKTDDSPLPTIAPFGPRVRSNEGAAERGGRSLKILRIRAHRISRAARTTL